ncbi:MAG: D-glycerate 3-kinase, partial [Candidatus Azotimanducaceae bacterium]
MKFTDQFGASPAEVRTFVTRFKTLSGPRSDDRYLQLLFNLAVNISSELDRSERKQAPLKISVTGAQGSGKSTLAGMLAIVLLEGFGVTTNVISLDDFYLSKADRLRLAANVHPMLSTRGVPGTHDIAWLSDVLDAHRKSVSTQCPVFNKATDDRVTRRRLLPPAQVL